MFLWKFQIEPLIQFFKNQKAAIDDFFYLFEKGKQLLERVATRIKEIFEGIKTTFQTKMNEIKLIFGIDKWIAIGKNIVEGIAQGIGQFAGLLKDAIVNMASNVMDCIKDSLGVEHSPSEITKKFGYELAAGIAVGFSDGMKAFNTSLGKMGGSNTLIPAFASAPASGAGVAGGGSSVVVNINAPILGFRDEYELGAKLGPIVEKYLKSHR
jgi:phage-related protein